MAYLTDLQLVPSSIEKTKTNYKIFRETKDHVEEIFRYYLPKKYNLHGQGKINITLGDDSSRKKQYIEIDGIGDYHYPNFQMQNYLALSQDQQEEKILSIIEDVFLDLAERFDADKTAIYEAVDKTRRTGFKLPIILPTSKFHRTRRFKAEVILTYKRGGADVEVRLVGRDGIELRNKRLIQSSWSHEIYHKYRKSKWEDDRFIIFSSSGNPSVEIDFSEEINVF